MSTSFPKRRESFFRLVEKKIELVKLLEFSFKNTVGYPGGQGLSVVLNGVLF